MVVRERNIRHKVITFNIVIFMILVCFSSIDVVAIDVVATEESIDITIPYLNTDGSPSPEKPDYEIWGLENMMTKGKTVEGTDENLAWSMSIIPLRFDNSEFDYIVHIQAIANPDYLPMSISYPGQHLPVNVQSMSLGMEYDYDSTTCEPGKTSHLVAALGEDSESLYSASYMWPEINGDSWILHDRYLDGQSDIDFDTYVENYLGYHEFSEEARWVARWLVKAGITSMFAPTSYVSIPFVEGLIQAGLISASIGEIIPLGTIDPGIDIDAGYEGGSYDRSWFFQDDPYIPDGRNNGAENEQWIQTVRNSFYYVESTIPPGEVDSGFTLTASVTYDDFWMDHLLPADGTWMDSMSISVKPDMFTSWNQPPQATPLAPNPDIVYTGETVTFDAENPEDREGDPISYVWDFGDGISSTPSNNPSATHAYSTTGTFHPKLKIYDNDHEKIYTTYPENEWQDYEDWPEMIVTVNPPISDWYNSYYEFNEVLLDIDISVSDPEYYTLEIATYSVENDGVIVATGTIFDYSSDDPGSRPTTYITDWPIPWSDIPDGLNYVTVTISETYGTITHYIYMFDCFVIRKDTGLPTTPTLISPSSESYFLYPITFNWNPSTDDLNDISEYQLKYIGPDASETTESSVINSEMFVCNSLPSGFGTYSWQVRAKDGAGNWGLWSSSNIFTWEKKMSININNVPIGDTNGWFTSDPGNVIDVDFASNGGPELDYARYKVGETGQWVNIFTNDITLYSNEWSVDWALLSDGENIIHIELCDIQGGIDTASITLKKDFLPPLGNIYINSNADQTQIKGVTIDLNNQMGTIHDSGSGLYQMRFANENTYDKQWYNKFQLIQSPHPVYPGDSMSFYLDYNGATKMRVHFEKIDIRTCDNIFIKDSGGIILATFSGSYPTGVLWESDPAANIGWIEIVMEINAVNSWQGYGFKIDYYGYFTPKWSPWEPFSTSKAWTLSGGLGEKTVYCEVSDIVGNMYQTNDQIQYAPYETSVTIAGTVVDGVKFTNSNIVNLGQIDSTGGNPTQMRFSNSLSNSWLYKSNPNFENARSYWWHLEDMTTIYQPPYSGYNSKEWSLPTPPAGASKWRINFASFHVAPGDVLSLF